MSYIYRLANVLLRGLVIYAVLGLERTRSDDLPSQSSDAASVATTGKLSPCRVTLQVSPRLFTHVQCSSTSPPLSYCTPVAFTGKAEECPAQGA